MIVAVKKLSNGQMYIDKDFLKRFSEEELPLYGYTQCWVEPEQMDCIASDFIEVNGVITFSIEKYNERKHIARNLGRMDEIEKRLTELSQDFIQRYLGAKFDDIDDRIAEFKDLHNELRLLQGKAPREY